MRRSTLALCALLLVGSLALPALASPQPTPVCGPCGGGFEEAATYYDVEQQFDVVHSTATVRVHRDGSATWTVRNRLGNESQAATLRDRPGLLRQIVDRAITRSTLEGPTENVSVRVENRTVVVTFEDPYATTRMPGGVHVVDYFHSRGYDTWPVLTADRLSVVGPEGTAVTNDPAGAEVRGRNATWYGNGSVKVWDAPTLTTDAYVTFAEPGPTAPATTTLAIALATLPIVVAVVGSFHLPALLLFGLALAGSSVVARYVRPRVSARRVTQAVGLLGGAVLGWSVLESNLEGSLLLGSGLLAVAMVVTARVREEEIRAWMLSGVGLLGLGAAAAVLVVTAPERSGSPLRTASSLLLLLPFAAAPVLGSALRVDRPRRTAGAFALVLGAFLAGTLSIVPPLTHPFGLAIVVLAGYALAAAVLSVPFLLLGATREV